MWKGVHVVFGSLFLHGAEVSQGVTIIRLIPLDLEGLTTKLCCNNDSSTGRKINWSVTCSPPLHDCNPVHFLAGGSVTGNPPLHDG